jgi:signal transduction histidine kinase/tetratricopeptide (TPR) repeat protein
MRTKNCKTGYSTSASVSLGFEVVSVSEIKRALQIGERVGCYRLIEGVGAGVLGDRFRIVTPDVDQTLILEVSHDAGTRARAAFETAAVRGSQLSHPGLERVLDWGETHDGRSFLVYANQGRHQALGHAGGRTLSTLVGWALGWMEMLWNLHRLGYVHRRVDPVNVMLTERGAPCLASVGWVGLASEPGFLLDPPFRDAALVDADALDGLSNLYCLGVMLYALWRGRLPAAAVDWQVVCAQEMPRRFGAVLWRLLASDRRERFENTQAAYAALAGCLDHRQTRMTTQLVSDYQPPDAFDAWRARLKQAGIHQVWGASGSGKTRLLQEAARIARMQGYRVTFVHALVGDEPYALLERLWRHCVADDPGVWLHLPDGGRRAIAAVWPWVKAPESSQDEVPWSFEQAFLKGFLLALKQDADTLPRMVLIDDWDLADAESRSILAMGFQQGFNGHHWLLAARVASDMDWSHRIAPLQAGAVERVVRTASIRYLTPRDVMRLKHLGCGHPGRVLDALRHLDTGAAGAWQEAAWQALDDFEQDVAAKLALWDRPVTDLRLLNSERNPGRDSRAALETLKHHGLVDQTPVGWQSISSHWQAWVLDRLTGKHRACLATDLARQLARHRDTTTELGLAHRVARLFALGDDNQQALEWALRAARLCQTQGANLTAITHCTLALQRPTPGTEHAPLMHALRVVASDARRLTGDWEQALGDYAEVLTQMTDPDARLGIQVSMAKCHQMRNRPDKARVLLREACAQSHDSVSSQTRLRALSALARLELHRGAHRDAARLYREVEGLAREVGAQAALAEALAYAGLRAAQRGRDGLPLLQEALFLRTRLGDALGLNDVHMMTGNAYLALGVYDAARAHFRVNLQHAVQVQALQEQAFAYLNLGICEMALAQWRAALTALGDARRLAQGLGDRFVLELVAPLMQACQLKIGERPKKARPVRSNHINDQTALHPEVRLVAALAKAQIALHHAAFEVAWQAAVEADVLGDHLGGSEHRLTILCLLAEAAIFSGRFADALQALKRLRRGVQVEGAWIPRFHLERLTGWYHRLNGAPEKTIGHWTNALNVTRQARHEVFGGQMIALIIAIAPTATPSEADPIRMLANPTIHDEPEWQLGTQAMLIRHLRATGQHTLADAKTAACQTLRANWINARPGTRLMRHPCRQLLLTDDGSTKKTSGRKQKHTSPSMAASFAQRLRESRTSDTLADVTCRWMLDETGAAEGAWLSVNQQGEWRVVQSGKDTVTPWQSDLARHCRAAMARLVDDASADGFIPTDDCPNTILVPLTGRECLHGFVALLVPSTGQRRLQRTALPLIAALASACLDHLHQQALTQKLSTHNQSQARRLEEVQHVLARQLDLESRRVAGLIADGHDLRAPLGAIHLSAQALQANLYGPLSEELTDVVAGMALGTKQALLVVDTMLDTACLDAGRLILHCAPTALLTVVEHVQQLLAGLAAAKHLRLCWHRAAFEALPAVWGDERRMVQVIQNVVDNAIKYSMSGSITLNAVHTDSTVGLTIMDEGPGLSVERLKNPFERLGTSVAVPERPGGSSGLGLWRVKRLMELHGGSVAIAPGPVCGTHVTLTWPVARGDRTQA